MLQQLFINCERIRLLAEGNQWGVEIINVLTSIPFILVALYLLRQSRREFGRNKDIEALAFLIGFIGVGSSLFHTFATIWAVVLDVAPIIVFVFSYVILFVRRIMGQSQKATVLAVAAFLAANIGIRFIFERGALNWTYIFFPTILCLGLMCFYLYRQRHFLRHYVAGSAVFFTLAVIARSVDRNLCGEWEYGTHYLWHLFNAVALYLSTRAMILHHKQAIEKTA